MRKGKGARRRIQALSALAHNAWLPGFALGRIWQGKSKVICAPGFNCYSCPGAVASCPIGAMQAVIGSREFGFAWYVLGTLLLFGLAAGRWICGWLCPFGLLQDGLHRVPGKKLKVPARMSRFRFVKYILLALFVVLLPAFAVNAWGAGDPWFCKYVCPAGTIEGALPLMAADAQLRSAAGLLFAWKAVLAAAVVALCVLVFRFFCRFLCPLGAIYGLMNRVSLYRMTVDKHNCAGCGACAKVCRMGVEPCREPNSAECIRCGDCVRACPRGALSAGFGVKDRTTNTRTKEHYGK